MFVESILWMRVQLQVQNGLFDTGAKVLLNWPPVLFLYISSKWPRYPG